MTNFQPPQSSDQLGFSYRRTGAQSFVSLNYPSTPFEITFRAAALRPDNRPVEMQVSINGKDVRLFALDSQPREYVLRSRLVLFGTQGLDLAFRPRSTFLEQHGDQPVEVGVALDWIEVRQAASRFGPVIPPPFVMGWWLLIGALPLGLARLVGRPWRLGLIVAGASFLLLNLLYLLPGPAIVMRLDWAQIGALLVILQVVTLWGVGFVSRLAWPGSPKPLRIPGWLWMLTSLILLYGATAHGRLTSPQELQSLAFSYNLAHLQPAQPIDSLLPEPPAGMFNPSHAADGFSHALVTAPLYRIAQRLARGTPYLPDIGVTDTGLLPYLMTWSNLMLSVGTVGVLYWLLRRLGYRTVPTLLTCGLAGLTTSLWPMAHTFNKQSLEGLALLLAIGSAFLYREKFGRGWLVFCGFWLGLLVADQAPNWLLLPVFVAYFYLSQRSPASHPTDPALPSLPSGPVGLFLPAPSPPDQPDVEAPPATFRPNLKADASRRKRSFRLPRPPIKLDGLRLKLKPADRRRLLTLCGPLLAWLIVVGWYNLAAFGSLWGGPTVNEFEMPWPTRIYAWLLSPAQGLLWRNPVLLAVVAGGLVWWRNARPLFKLIGAVGLVYLLGRLLWPWTGEAGWQLLEPLIGPFMLLVAPISEWAVGGIGLGRGERRLSAAILAATGTLGLVAQWLTLHDFSPAFAPDFYAANPFGSFAAAFQTTAALLAVGWLLLALLSYFRRSTPAL